MRPTAAADKWISESDSKNVHPRMLIDCFVVDDLFATKILC